MAIVPTTDATDSSGWSDNYDVFAMIAGSHIGGNIVGICTGTSTSVRASASTSTSTRAGTSTSTSSRNSELW